MARFYISRRETFCGIFSDLSVICFIAGYLRISYILFECKYPFSLFYAFSIHNIYYATSQIDDERGLEILVST